MTVLPISAWFARGSRKTQIGECKQQTCSDLHLWPNLATIGESFNLEGSVPMPPLGSGGLREFLLGRRHSVSSQHRLDEQRRSEEPKLQLTCKLVRKKQL